MTKYLNVFKDRAYGFYITLLAIALSFITAIVYVVNYKNDVSFMSWLAFAMLLVGAVVGLVCAFFRIPELGQAVLGVTSLIALLFFVKFLYGYVAVVAVGIDVDGLEPRFLACSVLMVLTLVASIVSIFAKQTVEANEAVEEKQEEPKVEEAQ